MSKTEQSQQWTSCTLSRAVATVAEAFANAPGIGRVQLAVVTRGTHDADFRLVLAADLDRARFLPTRWPSVLDISAMPRCGDVVHELDRFGAQKQVTGDAAVQSLTAQLNGVIDTESQPELDTSLDLSSPALMASPRSPGSGRDDLRRVDDGPRIDIRRSSSSRPQQEPTASMPAFDGRVFELWGRRGSWCNQRINGTEFRQQAVLAILPRDLHNGAEVATTANLIPEPDNIHDPHAVACFINNTKVGYLPRGDAVRYQPALARLVASGRLPTVPARVWAREYEDWDIDDRGRESTTKAWTTSVTVALAEPDMLSPLNIPPPRPRAELPGHAHAKVTGTQDHLDHLRAVLGDHETGWVYATLEPKVVETARTTKTVVAVFVGGRPVGTLTPQTSAGFLPVVEPLHAKGCNVVVRAVGTGSPVSATMNLYAARSHDIGRDWFADIAETTGIDLR